VSQNPVEQAADLLQKAYGPAPSTAIVLGSGLSGLVERLSQSKQSPYPAFGLPATGVAGHDGAVVYGRLADVPVVMLAGRVHVYEGRTLEQVVRNVRAVAAWGVERVVLTNAVGAVDPTLNPGSLVAVTDHLNLMGVNPLEGAAYPTGPRFPDLTGAYTATLRADALEEAESLGLVLHTGVYAGMRGPSYETPAEIRMLSAMGVSTVGMSTVPEVIALSQQAQPLLAVGMVSNLAAGHATSPLTHEEVTQTAARAGASLARLLEALVVRWG
jgi:purine-nucleoside phosphorylase